MRRELISVIMSVYNCADTLKESIDSILNQTYTNWHFIICNDCSTDKTMDILNEYKSQYPDKFTIIENKTNLRLAASLNHCLQYADGEYIARMDGDDISEPERFEKQIKFLKENKEIDLVGTAMRRFDKEGLHDIVLPPEKIDRYILKDRIPFHHATIMTYKYVYDKVGGYTVAERTKRAQDYDLWFKFFYNKFSGANIMEPLYLVREDINAIRRRTFKVRFNAFKTTCIGFKLLGYPKRWLFSKFIKMVFKSLVPSYIVLLYRKYQAKKINV